MKLTKAQIQGLQRIDKWTSFHGRAFHKEAAAKTIMAVRQNVLESLEKVGLINSARPFAGAYHHVTLTDAGRRVLAEQEERK